MLLLIALPMVMKLVMLVTMTVIMIVMMMVIIIADMAEMDVSSMLMINDGQPMPKWT